MASDKTAGLARHKYSMGLDKRIAHHRRIDRIDVPKPGDHPHWLDIGILPGDTGLRYRMETSGGGSGGCGG